MIDREKILKAAKYCLTSDPMRCQDECPYLIEGFSCGLDPFLTDIIAYLEEQEPVKPRPISFGLYKCGNCGHYLERIIEVDRFCNQCGRKVKWND